MENNRFKKLLEKFENGNATKEEIKLIESFFESMQDDGIDSDDVRRDLALRNRIYKSIHKKIRAKRQKRISRTVIAASAVAAGFFLFFSLTTIFNINSDQKQDWVLLENNFQNPKSFLLPDSSVVWLSPNSKLQYANDFGIKDRPTKLEGQAFFEVTKNPEQPFSVETGSIVTEVLGTSFNINEQDFTLEVSVSTGLVKVSNQKENFQLKPNQKVTYKYESEDFTQTETNSELQQLWWKGEVVLDKVKFSELAFVLQDLYQKKFVFKSNEAENVYLYSLKLKRDENLKSLLNRINYLNEVELTIKKNMIEISKKN